MVRSRHLMSNPSNYSLRSQGTVEDTVIHQPQSPVRPANTEQPTRVTETPAPVPVTTANQEPAPGTSQNQSPVQNILAGLQSGPFSMNNQIQLEPFKGQGQEPAKWFGYFERWATFMNMTDDRAALALPFHLKVIAKTWYDSLTEATQKSLPLLKAAFLNRFKPATTVYISVLTISQKCEETAEEYFCRFIDSNHAKDIPEALQVSILMKGLKSELLSLVMPKNPQTLEEMRQAMVLAEQTTSASKTKSVSALSHENNLHAEIQCLRNQLSEVLARQSSRQQQPEQRTWTPQSSTEQELPRVTQPNTYQPWAHDYNNQKQWNQQQRSGQYSPQQRPQYYQQPQWKCNYCGGKRLHSRNNCPASHKICHKCGKKGHFQNECQGSRMSNQNYK